MNSNPFPSSDHLDLHLESCWNLLRSLESLELEISQEEKKSANSEGRVKQNIFCGRYWNRRMLHPAAETSPASVVITSRLKNPSRVKPAVSKLHRAGGFNETVANSNSNLGNETESVKRDGVTKSWFLATDNSTRHAGKQGPSGIWFAPEAVVSDSNFGRVICPKCGKRKRRKQKVSSSSIASCNNLGSSSISSVSSSFIDRNFPKTSRRSEGRGSSKNSGLPCRRRLWCEDCNSCLVELKRQAIRRWLPEVTCYSRSPAEVRMVLEDISQVIYLPDQLSTQVQFGVCQRCQTSFKNLAKEVLSMIASFENHRSTFLLTNGASYKFCNFLKAKGLQETWRLDSLISGIDDIPKSDLLQGNSRSFRHDLWRSSDFRLAVYNHRCRSESSLIGRDERLGSADRQVFLEGESSSSSIVEGQRLDLAESLDLLVQDLLQIAGAECIKGDLSERSFPLGTNMEEAGTSSLAEQTALETSETISGKTANKSDKHICDISDETRKRISETCCGESNLSSERMPMSPVLASFAAPSPMQSENRGKDFQTSFFDISDRFPSLDATISGCSSEDVEKDQKRLSRGHQRDISGHQSCTHDTGDFPTNFAKLMAVSPPDIPPELLGVSDCQSSDSGRKVRVILCVSQVNSETDSFLSLDTEQNRVTVLEPLPNASLRRRQSHTTPKIYAFDAVCPQNAPLNDICSASLIDTLQSVINGSDGCIFTYGHSRLGKTYSMFGTDDVKGGVGIIPSAISWLYRLIEHRKERTVSRFSVRVSAAQLIDRTEQLKDLLNDFDWGRDSNHGDCSASEHRPQTKSRYLLQNLLQLRTTSAEHLAYYLDAALAASSFAAHDDHFTSHLFLTINIYHYRTDKSFTPHGSVSGGRSRLHFVDLGSVTMATKDPSSSSLSTSAVGDVLRAILSGQQHIPYSQWKLPQLLKECLGKRQCHSCCMVAQVSSAMSCYNETLEVLELAASISRLNDRLKKSQPRCKHPQTDDESYGSLPRSRSRMHRGIRMGLRGGEHARAKGSYSDTEHYMSGCEQTCGETVIYLGNNIRNSVTSQKQSDVRRAVAARRLNQSAERIFVDSASGFRLAGSDFDNYTSCPERESQCCRHGLLRPPMDVTGGANGCQPLEMSGGDNQRCQDNWCQAIFVRSCEVETDGRSVAVGANGYLSTGVTVEPNSQSRHGKSHEGSIRIREDSGFYGSKQRGSVPRNSAVCTHSRFRDLGSSSAGHVWVDGPSCEFSDAVLYRGNTPQDDADGGMVYPENGNWMDLYSSTGCRQSKLGHSMVRKTACRPSTPHTAVCCHYASSQPCHLSDGHPVASSYHLHSHNQRAGSFIAMSEKRLDHSERLDHSVAGADRAVLGWNKRRPIDVCTLPSSRTPQSHYCKGSRSSFVDSRVVDAGIGRHCRQVHLSCNGALARSTATRPAKSVSDRTALWVKAVQGYCSHNLVQSYEGHNAASNFMTPELIYPLHHGTFSESLANSIHSPNTVLHMPVPCESAVPRYKNPNEQDVLSEEQFIAGHSLEMADAKLWYTAKELAELGYDVFPKRNPEALAETPISQSSTYDEDLEKELDLLCDTKSSGIEDKDSISGQSIPPGADKFPNASCKSATASGHKLWNNDCNFPTETPTIAESSFYSAQNSEKESTSRLISKCNSLSQRSLALPDGSSNPTIFEKSQSSQNDDILGKPDSFGDEGSSMERCVEGKSREESITGHVDVVCLSAVESFNRSLSADMHPGERARCPEFYHVLEPHGNTLMSSVTEQSSGDLREIGNNLLLGHCRKSEQNGTAQLLLNPILKVPTSGQHRRSTLSLTSAVSTALRGSSALEKSEPVSWRRCHSHETSISHEPCLMKIKGGSNTSDNKSKGQKLVRKVNQVTVNGSRKAANNCRIPMSSGLSSTADTSSGYESMAQGTVDSTLTRHLARNVCSNSMTKDPVMNASLGRSSKRKGDASSVKISSGVDESLPSGSSSIAQTNTRNIPEKVTSIVGSLEPLPIAIYSAEEVERMENWSRNRRIQLIAASQGQDELNVKLVKRRDDLKQELLAARKLLTTSDCQELDFLDTNDFCSIEQLKKEIECLAELVAEHKARIMIVTSFDSNVR